MGLSPEFIADVIERSDLAELAAAEVVLKPSGGELKGCCPFHADKNPSFYVYVRQGRQAYHCFGCEAKGDVIDYVMRSESLDFTGAIEVLARRAGIPMPSKDEPSSKGARVRARARAELDRRIGRLVTDDLGRYESVREFASTGGVRIADLERAGAGYEEGSESIVLPVFDGRENVVSVVSWTGAEETGLIQAPSCRTVLFDPAEGLYRSKGADRDTRRTDCAWLMEMPEDVLAMGGHGARNAYCTLGVMPTGAHMGALFDLASRVDVVIPDDPRGHRFAAAALEASLEEIDDGWDVTFTTLGPDGTVRGRLERLGLEGLLEARDEAEQLVEYVRRVCAKDRRPGCEEEMIGRMVAPIYRTLAQRWMRDNPAR